MPRYPDCSTGGPCRPRQLHFLHGFKNIAVQVCRICGKPKYREFKIVGDTLKALDITDQMTKNER